MATIARITNTNVFMIAGQVDETATGKLSMDAVGNVNGLEIIEGIENVRHLEESQADFSTGTLTNMVATSDGYLEVIKNTGVTTTTLEDFNDTTFNFTFTASGTIGWARDTTTFYQGTGSYKSGAMTPTSKTHKQSSTSFTVSIPTGVVNPKLSMYYKVSSEANYDWFRAYVNNTTQGAEVLKKSGTIDWTYFETPLVVGQSNTIKFEYDIDGATSVGSNASWVDNVQISYSTAGTQQSGNRISPNIDLTGLSTISSTNIGWSVAIPIGTTFSVETSISTDGGATWGAWITEANDTSIASLTGITDTTNLFMRVRISMTTSSDGVSTPSLNDITLTVNGSSVFKQDATTLTIGSLEEGVIF